MKKTRFLLLLALVAFAATGFTACTSEDEIVSEGQENELTGDPIKAQFTITVPMYTGHVTRQSAGVVQDGADIDVSKFRGIDNINLFPSSVASTSFEGTSAVSTKIELSQMLKPIAQTVSNYIPKTNLWANNKSVLYNDVQLTTGTKTFLFYGKAIDNAVNVAITSVNDMFKYGTLTATIPSSPSTPAAISFSPKVISTKGNSSTKRTNLLAYINSIADAKYTEGTTTYSWKATGVAGLSALYTSFTSMRAGSSKNLEAAVEDLYNTLKGSTDKMAIAICTAIEGGAVTITAPTAAVDKYTVTFNDALAGYPSVSDNLPDGAANVKWSGTAFQYIEDKEATVTSPENVTPIENYVFPANLYYWVKSGIMTSKTPQASNFNESMTWDDDASTGIFNKYTDGDAITSNTQSLILTAPVQYGVARLDIKVAAAGNALADNGAGTKDGQKNVDISKIKLTGVLIGSQNTVGWNFQKTGDEGYTMYDNIIKSKEAAEGVAISTASFITMDVMNHTLVLETAGAANEKVNVALEFVNNGPDFWGQGGIVPTGTKFYLVGALDTNPAAGGPSTVSKPEGYDGNKVFKQDFTTFANFTITNLQKATNFIPDLRNPRLELGLSVNLTWQEGITFGYEFK